jgi:catechol 2,3-dioxygenase-like lactoylglutathione lyase family enzyme
MSYTSVLAQAAVTNLSTTEAWYVTLLGRQPDERPMDGLLEWHVTAGGGVQVWVEPERAGRSTLLLATDHLDETASRLTAAGLSHDGPERGGAARLLRLADPDGNRVILVGR